MKTRNNVQKTITKSLAVIISLVLISITVNAQIFWRTVLENNSFSQIAMAMTEMEASSVSDDASSSSDMSTFAEYASIDKEEALEVENWMVNENNFYTSFNMETEVENSLEIENWMTNESFFDGASTLYGTATEEALEIEEWMVDNSYFEVSTETFEEETEQELQIEAWMTNAEIWKM